MTHGAFFHRVTEASGSHELGGSPVERAFVWTQDPKRTIATDAEAIRRVVIRLGDDLSVGQHRLEVALPAQSETKSLWIRAVLVGSVMSAAEGAEP